MIKSFVGQYDFLSNFHPSQILYEGILYPTVEHAFQAAKTQDKQVRQQIADKDTPGKAKRAGGKRGILKDFDQAAWDTQKVQVMETLLRLKFQDQSLREKLLATGDTPIQEGNNWNDTYWGVSLKTGKGQNMLGKLLEKIRHEITP
jgi:ribA/ribD-fused uncharacterized protein